MQVGSRSLSFGPNGPTTKGQAESAPSRQPIDQKTAFVPAASSNLFPLLQTLIVYVPPTKS